MKKLRINFKAVVVILFGIFCLYAYFRLINPYLDVGGNSKTVPESVFSRKVVNINDEKYSYWTNSVVSPRKILVMLPPSSATGDYFGKYAATVPKDILIVAPDYPGRGLTDGIESFDTVPAISKRIGILLKALLVDNNFDIIAPSFGGMIGTELARDSDLKIDKIFLIATGEFFAKDQKFMYRALFYPATISERARSRYVSLLTGGDLFPNIDSSNIEDILEQWLTTMDYKIDTTRKSKVLAIIISFNRDNVVQPGSVSKLQKVFINNSVINIDLTHTSPSFFNIEILDIILNNI